MPRSAVSRDSRTSIATACTPSGSRGCATAPANSTEASWAESDGRCRTHWAVEAHSHATAAELRTDGAAARPPAVRRLRRSRSRCLGAPRSHGQWHPILADGRPSADSLLARRLAAATPGRASGVGRRGTGRGGSRRRNGVGHGPRAVTVPSATAALPDDHDGPRPSHGVGAPAAGEVSARPLRVPAGWRERSGGALGGRAPRPGRRCVAAKGEVTPGPVAVVDCGTNTTRLLVTDGQEPSIAGQALGDNPPGPGCGRHRPPRSRRGAAHPGLPAELPAGHRPTTGHRR